MSLVRKNIAGTIVIVIGFAIAYWLNSDQWVHPALTMSIGVATGLLSSAANDIVGGASYAAYSFKRGFEKGWRGEK